MSSRHPISLATAAPEPTRSRDRRFVWHPWSPITVDRSELTIVRGKGHRVWDVDGAEYVDASSLNATCGYAHPMVVAAVTDQLMRLHGLDISVASHDLAGQLAERLAGLLPPPLSRTLFVNSGSEGIEAAMLIAYGRFGNEGRPRSRVVTLTLGYHGSTLMTRSLSGLPRVGHPFHVPLQVDRVDLPMPPREVRKPAALPALLEAFEQVMAGYDPPMAVLVEPFLNVGGGVVLPPGLLSGLRRLCDDSGALLVLDEVFTAFGRTGRMFAFEHDGAAPDVLVTSKGLAGGYQPIAAVTVREDIYAGFGSEPVIGGLRYGHTTSGHAAACAAALAVLDLIEDENLLAQADKLGTRLLSRLDPLVESPAVVDVRGLGPTVVLEMASVAASDALLTAARGYGVLLRQHGPVLMAVPPLTIDDDGIDAVAAAVERSVPDAG